MLAKWAPATLPAHFFDRALTPDSFMRDRKK